MKNTIVYAVSRQFDQDRYQDPQAPCYILKRLTKGEVCLGEIGGRTDLFEKNGYYTLGYFYGPLGERQLSSKDKDRLHLIDAVYQGDTRKFDFYLNKVYRPSLKQNPGAALELITYMAAIQPNVYFMEKLLAKEEVQIHPDALISAAEAKNNVALKLLLERCLGLDGKSPSYVNGQAPKFPSMAVIDNICGNDLRNACANVPHKELKACVRAAGTVLALGGGVAALGSTTCLVTLATASLLGYAFLSEPTKINLRYMLETDLSVFLKCISTKPHAAPLHAAAHANYGGAEGGYGREF